MIIDNKAHADELRAWLRGESPLVQYSRTLRMEGPTPATSEGNPQNPEGEKPVDPFDGIDFDSLDKETADKLKQAQSGFALLQKSTATLKEERDRLDKEGRGHQSRADRYGERLRAHNLDGDQQVRQQKAADPVQELADGFVSDGMKPEVALAYAKMFTRNNAIQEEKIIQRVGAAVVPLAQTVGNIHADRAISDAIQSDTDGVFQLPGLQDQVKESVKSLVSQGQVVSIDLVNNLRDMALGAYIMKNGTDSVIAIKQKQQQQPATRFSTRQGGGGGFNNPQHQQQQGAPVAANAETAAAANAVALSMRRGLPAKGGKK